MKLPRLSAILTGFMTLFLAVEVRAKTGEVIESDICVFGGTSGGIAAAVQASRMGKSVVIAEPSQYVGGMTTGGLGATDIGNKSAIGGISREFYQRVAAHYSQESAWVREARDDYFKKAKPFHGHRTDSPNTTMWTFEPHVAGQIFQEMLKEAGVRVYREQLLASAKKDGARLAEIVMENGNVFRAKMFIDATYEGDLMAKAGVSYFVGRESNDIYGETLNGIREKTLGHQFTAGAPVDPYINPGDPASGLIPLIQNVQFGAPGDGDKSLQAYNYRLCLTNDPDNRRPIEPPSDYRPETYELLARYIEALMAVGKEPKKPFWVSTPMPNRKTDTNNRGAVSTDFIGMNYDYPEAGYATREKIAKAHENYIRGLFTFMASSPRIPGSLREETKKWGLCKDEFPETNGWPYSLYVREARRMISDIVVTERHCRGEEIADDPVGLAAYMMDSHNCRRLVRNGRAMNEGDTQAGGFPPYPISYRAIIPKLEECENLAVPVCLAASHIAYGSIRMEPVFMILGQSAATAATLSIDEKVPLQKLDYAKLRSRLLEDRQILEWNVREDDSSR